MSVVTGSPDQPDVQASFCATCVDEWARAGVTEAVVCPGSRSTPLTLALAADARIRVHVRLDERSAGFFGLGMSLSTGRPAVVCTTSGTAAAELHPAVVEAFHARVPLLICTANRPPRLQGVRAPQVINQEGIFRSAVSWSASPGVPQWSQRGSWRSLASRAAAESLFGPFGPGPVHLDLAFDEPLTGTPGELPEGRPDGAPWHEISAQTAGAKTGQSPSPAGKDVLAAARILFVVGSGCGRPDSVLGAAKALLAPVVADPLSGCRKRAAGVIAAADAVLRDDEVAGMLRPEVVIRLGGLPASKILSARLHEWALAGTKQLLVDDRWGWADPDRDAVLVIRAQPESWCESVRAWADPTAREAVRAWYERWVLAEERAQKAIDNWCSERTEVTEPALARCLVSAIPPSATLFVSSSMPVRDLEWFAPALESSPRVLSNRGANGIDGVVSTAMGIAYTRDGPVVALVGDLAFLHDLSAWVGARPHDPGLVAVVVDNGGGGIFSFLPQHSLVGRETFEELFGTPQAVGIGPAARGLGVGVTEVSTILEVESAVDEAVSSGETRVVVVHAPGRDENVEHHRTLNEAITSHVRTTLAWGA